MALADGVGVELYPYEGKLPAHAAWFGEDQGRYVLAAKPGVAEQIAERARLLGLPARIVGKVGGVHFTLKGETPLSLAELRHIHEGWLPGLMGP
jgi:phosphoribosylformylglycinamidine synthase subunit PurL